MTPHLALSSHSEPFRVPERAMGEVLLSLVESGEELDRVQRLRLMDVIHEQFVLQRGTK